MIDLVQGAKPLTYSVMHEGLLVADESREMIAGATRPQPFYQMVLSAEVQSRVELWREYTPPPGQYFKVAYRDGAYYLGDDGGNLHYSADGMTWAVWKKFSAEISGVVWDGDIEAHGWVSTVAGEIWRWTQDDDGAITWDLSFSDPSLKLVGLGLADSAVVALIYGSKSVVRSTDLHGGPWIVDEVFEKVLYPWGCSADHPGTLWAATYESKPRYSSDGGETWTQTSGAAGNAISSICSFYGTVIAGGPGGAWRTDDDGVTWTQVINTSPTFIGGISGGPAGWVAIGGGGIIYVSDDDGVTWTERATRAEGGDPLGQRPEATAMLDTGFDENRMLAVFKGSVMLSLDSGVTWKAGTGGEPWRISIEAYQPMVLDLPYEVPANERLVGCASEETFVLVGG